MNRREFLKKGAAAVTFLTGTMSFPYTLAANQREENSKLGHIEELIEEPDCLLLARMLFGEARSLFDDNIDPDYKEPIMIGWTAINRVDKKFKGNNLKEVLLCPRQYSCFNPGDPNLEKLKNPLEHDVMAWIKCVETSINLLGGNFSHLNYGQDHYHTKGQTPLWTKDPGMKKIWGQPFFKHKFYEKTIA